MSVMISMVGATGYGSRTAASGGTDRRTPWPPRTTAQPARRRPDSARHALAEAAAAGAGRAWLFSRRSGPFWRGLGFQEADRDALAAALPDARQVVAFRATGQLAREVAWSRSLGAAEDDAP